MYLWFWRKKCNDHSVCVNEVDVNADVIVVYVMEVKRVAIRTDVTLSRKRRDGDCVPQTRERHVITQCSIYIPLKTDKMGEKLKKCYCIFYSQLNKDTQ